MRMSKKKRRKTVQNPPDTIWFIIVHKETFLSNSQKSNEWKMSGLEIVNVYCVCVFFFYAQLFDHFNGIVLFRHLCEYIGEIAIPILKKVTQDGR